MTDSANPRRSVRSKKKTTFFSIGNRKQVLESIKESDEKQSDDSEGNAEEESIEETRNYDADQADDDSDNMEEFDLSNQALQGQSSKRKPRGVKTTKPAKKRKIDTKMNESSIDINSLSLFGKIKAISIYFIGSAIDRYIYTYSSDTMQRINYSYLSIVNDITYILLFD